METDIRNIYLKYVRLQIYAFYREATKTVWALSRIKMTQTMNDGWSDVVCVWKLCETAVVVVVVVALLLDQLVDVVLGAVLAGGHLEHIGSAEEGLLGVPVGDHLQCRCVDIRNRYMKIKLVDRSTGCYGWWSLQLRGILTIKLGHKTHFLNPFVETSSTMQRRNCSTEIFSQCNAWRLSLSYPIDGDRG